MMMMMMMIITNWLDVA